MELKNTPYIKIHDSLALQTIKISQFFSKFAKGPPDTVIQTAIIILYDHPNLTIKVDAKDLLNIK